MTSRHDVANDRDQTGRVIGLDELVDLETAVWEALVAGDAGADVASLTDDFLGVYPTGLAGRDDHGEQLADGPTVASFEIVEPRMLPIDDDHALLVYRADYRRPGVTGTGESMYVSSLWERRDGRWLNSFSQDTPVDPDSTAP